MANERDKREHLISLLEDFDNVMLVTRSPEGRIHGRPLAVAEVEPNGDLYFATAIDSGKVAELARDPTAAIMAQSKLKWVSLSGTATVVKDRALIDRLWKESWKVWFPSGKEDPDLVLLHFDAKSGEFWDNSGSRGIAFLIESAKAYLTGDRNRREEADTDHHVTL